MDTMTDDSSFSNHTGSNYSLPNEVNSTAKMPLSIHLGISVTGNQSIILFTVGVFGLVSNVYVIIVVALHKPMHKHLTNMYIINQSMIDGLASAILILQAVFENNAIVNQYTQGNIADETLCRLWHSEFLIWGLMDSSTYNIVALTIERYLAIVHPIWYKTKFSNNKVMIGLSISFVWFIGLAYNASCLIPLSSISTSGLCTINNYPGLWGQFVVGVMTFAFELFIPVILIVYGYSVMVWSIHKRTKISSGEESGNANNKEQTNESMVRARHDILRTSVLIALFFIICWSSHELFSLAYHLNASCCQNHQSAFNIITTAMIPLNCCANPIIYSLTYREFKKGAARLFTRVRKSTWVEKTTSSSVKT